MRDCCSWLTSCTASYFLSVPLGADNYRVQTGVCVRRASQGSINQMGGYLVLTRVSLTVVIISGSNIEKKKKKKEGSYSLAASAHSIPEEKKGNDTNCKLQHRYQTWSKTAGSKDCFVFLLLQSELFVSICSSFYDIVNIPQAQV